MFSIEKAIEPIDNWNITNYDGAKKKMKSRVPFLLGFMESYNSKYLVIEGDTNEEKNREYYILFTNITYHHDGFMVFCDNIFVQQHLKNLLTEKKITATGNGYSTGIFVSYGFFEENINI